VTATTGSATIGSAAPATLTELWRQSVASGPSRPFLRFEAPDGSITEWTYGEFDELVGRVATTFADHGVGPDAGVHLALTNTPTFVAAWLAATSLGSSIVPSDPHGTAPELAEHLSRTSPAVGLCATTRADIYRDGVSTSGLRGLSIFEVDETGSTPLPSWIATESAREADRDAAVDGERLAAHLERDVDPRSTAGIMFTSGTTGRPKGVVITQANYGFAGTTMAAAAGLGPDDRQLVVLPLFHANAQYYSFASAIAVGASVALVHTFSASGFVAQAARHGATHASLFAGPIRMILARGRALTADDGLPELRLRHCWYAQNLADDQYATIADWLGCRPRQLYGMTETIPAVLTDSPTEPRPDAMGFVTIGCQVDLHDEAGNPVDAGTVGEVVVGGEPGITLFAGYLDDPTTTANSYRDGWFRTGDRAWRDADGRYFFDGRRADVLKVSGENVSVVEVEAVIGAHPDVHEVVVVGAPDPIRDEVPVAFVVPAGTDPQATVDDAARTDALVRELESWAGARLGKAKRPHRYVVVADLPRTSVGKIRKFLLTESASRTGSNPDRDESPHPPSAEVPT
jgi:crotonobetaine/carnitine-CoA ligase